MTSIFTESNENLRPGLILDDHYQLGFLAGHGRMGEVWKARDIRKNCDVALKFIPSDILQFRNEMRRIRTMFEATFALKHQSICPIYSMEENPEYGCYLVMDWIPNQTLEHYISDEKFEGGRIPKKTALVILRSIAEALDYAHGQKVVHRDLKPTNIVLKKDKNGEVIGTSLIDFGLAAEIRECSTRVTQSNLGVTGIPSYMPPEQWQSRRQDGRTDQYSLATIAYELFSGKLPFTGKTIEILRASVLNDTPEKISGVDGNINRALLKALSKSPAKRFKTCGEFIDALSNPHWYPAATKWIFGLIALAVLIIALGAWKFFG